MRIVAVMTMVAALFGCAAMVAPPSSNACLMAPDDLKWVGDSLSAWRLVRQTRLHLADAPPPDIVVFDARCAYRRGSGERVFLGAPHNNAVPLPDGQSMPPQVASFAAPYGEGQAFFVMALPPVWRAGHVESELGLETLMTAVLVHEMTHTRQFYVYNARLTELGERYHLGDDLDDDIVQNTFQGDAAFVAEIDAERDLLFRAAAAPSNAEARLLAREVLTRIQARQARFYTGDNAKFLELEDVFLTMEGVGQWAAYAWITHPRGANIEPTRALPLFRRGGRFWSQDEGLALFLVIDRLVPDWQARAFAPAPETALALLARAAA